MVYTSWGNTGTLCGGIPLKLHIYVCTNTLYESMHTCMCICLCGSVSGCIYFKDHKTSSMDSLSSLHVLSNYLPTPPSVLPASLTTMKPPTTVFPFTAPLPHYSPSFQPLSWSHSIFLASSVTPGDI